MERTLAIFQNSNSFTVSRPVFDCFTFFSDITNIGKCIPGCEEVNRVNETTANLKVKVKIGMLSKSIKFRVLIKEANSPSNLKFEGTSDDASLSGSLSLENQDKETTKILYELSLRSLSTLASTAFSMMGKGLADQQARQFVACVKKNLEVSK